MLLGGIFQRKVVRLSKCFGPALFKEGDDNDDNDDNDDSDDNDDNDDNDDIVVCDDSDDMKALCSGLRVFGFGLDRLLRLIPVFFGVQSFRVWSPSRHCSLSAGVCCRQAFVIGSSLTAGACYRQ